MSNRQGTVSFSNAMSYVIILFVFVAVCGFLAYFTNGFTDSFKTFYVEIEDKQILSSVEGLKLSTNEPLNVDVRYTFEVINNEIKGYSVKVIPNTILGNDFDFSLDGSIYSYQAEKDLTLGFDIDYGENSFKIKPKGGITEILSAVYPNNEIGDCEDKAYENMFVLVISSYNDEASVTVYFSVLEKVSSIFLDQEVIIF